MSDKAKYRLTVGIETHVQLKTRSKLFSGADNNAEEAKPNTLVNHIDFGLPGALPVLNKKAVELAARAAFALNTKPAAFSKFDRKHYFYPDLPMGYQISQFDQPIVVGGSVSFMAEGTPKTVNITRAHLEADAGKSLHPDTGGYSLVDLNRAGTPLLEIVSEPEIHSAAEARAYARELYLLMRYAGVSDANLYYGNMRFDVNVSLSTDGSLGTRTETKNLNSFRSVERAVIEEARRQADLLDRGQKIIQETRGWDDAKGIGYTMRTKENADDYRYMPDPDLPPIELDEAYVKSVADSMPKLPSYWRQQLAKHNLGSSITESLIESEVDLSLNRLAYLSSLKTQPAKVVSNWVVNIEVPLKRRLVSEAKTELLDAKSAETMYGAIYAMVEDSKLSSNNAKGLIERLLTADKLPADIESFAAETNLIQNSDEAALSKIVEGVLAANPKAVSDIEAGETKATAFLVGQVMKESKGQANPSVVTGLITAKIKTKES